MVRCRMSCVRMNELCCADLPKGYQISQYDEPICTGGAVEVDLPDGSKKRFGITRAHLEEDSGKTVYGGADRLAGSEYSLVDYNRAGRAVRHMCHCCVAVVT